MLLRGAGAAGATAAAAAAAACRRVAAPGGGAVSLATSAAALAAAAPEPQQQQQTPSSSSSMISPHHDEHHRAFRNIPIVDVARLCGPSRPSDGDVAEVGAQLHAACRDVGFFYAINHGVPASVTDAALQKAQAWFALPEETKRRHLLSAATHFRGYQPLGANVTRYKRKKKAAAAVAAAAASATSAAGGAAGGGGVAGGQEAGKEEEEDSKEDEEEEEGFVRDAHEALDFFAEHGASGSSGGSSGGIATITPSPLHGRNLWPDEVPGLADALRAYVHAVLGAGERLLEGIAAGMGLPRAAFSGGFAGRGASYWVFRAIHYPPLAASAADAADAAAADARSSGSGGSSSGGGGGGDAARRAVAAARGDVGRDVPLGCGEHTDYGLLTLIHQQPGVTALQVRNSRGAWVDAPPVPGALVCNIGDMFRVITNGLYTPTVHRVVHTTSGGGGGGGGLTLPRTSLPVFHEPAFDAVVKPLPHFGPPRFEPVRYGEHLESKVLTNFEGL